MPQSLHLHTGVDLHAIAEKYELTGASIINAVLFAVLQCYARSSRELLHTDIMDGIRKELMKEEKSA